MTDLVQIDSFTAQLGDREYQIKTAGFIRSKPWKRRLIDEVQPIFEEIGKAEKLKFDAPADLLKIIPVMETLFLDSIDKFWDLLRDYAPELEEDKEYIEAHATDKQILAAFQGAVKLADPFGVVGLMMRQVGLKMTGTSSNLQSASGDSG